MKTCKITNCPSKATKRGWCDKHWRRWWRHGDPEKVLKYPSWKGVICPVTGCERQVYAHRLCFIHYTRKLWRETHNIPVGDLSVHLGHKANRLSGTPEYRTVAAHFHLIKKNPNYIEMPFFNEWNPECGGSFWKGAAWIIEYLGKRPASNWSLDIIRHEVGFVPGNLRWAYRQTQQQNKRHRTLGQIPLEVLRVELFGRGYTIRKRRSMRVDI